MDSPTAFAASVLGRAVIVARREWRLAIVLVAIDSVPRMALEFAPDDMGRLSSLLGLVTLYLQLLATFRTLEALGAAPPDYDRHRPTEGRYPAAFLLSLLTSIPILIGFVLLVVPGVLLLAMWGMAMASLAAERRSPLEAMHHSWRLARPRLGGMVSLAVAWLATLLLPIAAAIGIDLAIGPSIAIYVTLDLAVSIAMIGAPVLWAAAYTACRPAPSW